MSNIVIFIFADTNTVKDMGRFPNAFMLASEAAENGDNLKIIFESVGTKWIGELEREDHKLNKLYSGLKDKITGVCSFCAQAFGVKGQIEQSGLILLSEHKQYPSPRKQVV